MKEPWGRFWGNKDDQKAKDPERIVSVPISDIVSNPYQPRKYFEEEKIKELAQSISTYGLLQPIILTKAAEGYQIAAGERRFLACSSLGWKEIPAIVREYQDSTLASVALIENLQRENLDFIEEAQGYKRLLEEFNLTQEVLAQRLGKSQSTIANKLRLLNLPEEILGELRQEKLTERHARSLLKLKKSDEQKEVLQTIIDLELNVKETEELIDNILGKEEPPQAPPPSPTTPEKSVKKVVIRDLRIFSNTIRQAVKIIEKAGIKPEVSEKDEDDFWEIRIRLRKKV